MTSIFRDMLQAANALKDNPDLTKRWLAGDDAGLQLAAIAYAYAFPETLTATCLVEVMMRSKQPFVQQWALRAIQRMVDTYGVAKLSPIDIEQLERYEKRTKPGDRTAIAASVNRAIRRHTEEM